MTFVCTCAAYRLQVSEYDRVDQIKAPARGGVYVHGLYLDAAMWSKADKYAFVLFPCRSCLCRSCQLLLAWIAPLCLSYTLLTV